MFSHHGHFGMTFPSTYARTWKRLFERLGIRPFKIISFISSRAKMVGGKTGVPDVYVSNLIRREKIRVCFWRLFSVLSQSDTRIHMRNNPMSESQLPNVRAGWLLGIYVSVDAICTMPRRCLCTRPEMNGSQSYHIGWPRTYEKA